MKKIVTLLLFILVVSLNADAKFTPFIDEQVRLIESMNEANTSKEDIEKLVMEQEDDYNNAINELMKNTAIMQKHTKHFDTAIFALKKVIAINKRAGNSYAVLRDEVQVRSYTILKHHNIMLINVLSSLNEPSLGDFQTKLNKYTIENQNIMHKLYEHSYADILALPAGSKVLEDTKKYIHEYNALKEVNADTIGYIYKYSDKMYRLNKYSIYHLVSLAIYIDSIPIISLVNPYLHNYGLNVLKIVFIILLSLFIYFFRKIVYVYLEKSLLKIDFLRLYSESILLNIRKTLETIIIIININMVIYVYNDFGSVEVLRRSFNILYAIYFTVLVFKVVNTVATIKLSQVSDDASNIKNDLVNVGIKILNFIIIIIGLLLVLFIAGVDLTTVLSGLGIGGFAVAFAAKDTISNFFGTLSILFSDVFSQGDWIEIDGHQGVVVEIGLRVTTIRTFDNALIAIPNGTFAAKDVKNWDRRTLGRRIKMSVGVKYDSRREDIKNAITEIRVMLDKHSGIATKATRYEHSTRKKSHTAKLVSKDDLNGVKNTLLVYLDEFSDSSINILIYCFTKSVRWAEWLETKEDVMFQIMEILEKNSLEFAFPSLSLYHESEPQDMDKLN